MTAMTPDMMKNRTALVVAALRAHAKDLESDAEFHALNSASAAQEKAARVDGLAALELAKVFERDGMYAPATQDTNAALVKALTTLRREARDWQKALGAGDRPSLDKALASADAALTQARTPRAAGTGALRTRSAS